MIIDYYFHHELLTDYSELFAFLTLKKLGIYNEELIFNFSEIIKISQKKEANYF